MNAFNSEIIQITVLSLEVSVISVFIATLLGVPLGTFLGLKKFPFKNIIIALVNTGMGLPPVVVGIFIAVLLWRSGPLGSLDLMYTPSAIIIAQTIIAFPLVAGISMAAIQSIDNDLIKQTIALGTTGLQFLFLIWREARMSIMTAIIAGFGGVISEVGAALMVGGNIRGQTRILTTAAVLETRMGNFNAAIVLGLILLFISFLVNFALTFIQLRSKQ